jgi:dihydrofolate reductase
MRQINVLTFVTMDGVMQAPGAPEEDTSGGFRHSGWSVGYFDESVGAEMAKRMGHGFDLLLGRRTYDIFAAHWPHAKDPFADLINQTTKYVATNHPLTKEWKNTVRLQGDVAQAIRKLKEGTGPELQVHGSGRRIFGEGPAPAGFALVGTSATPSGVIIAKYRRAGEVKSGSFAPPT